MRNPLTFHPVHDQARRAPARFRPGPGAWMSMLALALATGPVFAHDDAYLDTLDGPHGGQLRVAGQQHLELVVDPPPGAPASEQPVAVYLTDHADRPIASAGFGARAAILANRERVTVDLSPQAGHRLSGLGVFGHDPDMVVVVTLQTPEGDTEQARFTPYKRLDGSPREVGAAAPHGHHEHHGHHH